MNLAPASLVVVAVFQLIASGAHAAGTASNTTIDEMMMDENYDAKLFVKMAAPVNDKALCSSHPVWDFVLDTSTALGLQMYAILLNAYDDNLPLTLLGTNDCGVFNQIETLRRIDLL